MLLHQTDENNDNEMKMFCKRITFDAMMIFISEMSAANEWLYILPDPHWE